MIELRTLGALDLKGADGCGLQPILAQSKRLALLVYLVLAGPHRSRRRDTIVSFFWPELDQDHARGALRQAVRFLRRHLGDGVVVGRTDEELAVRADRVWSDALAFEEACQAGQLDEALELYRGDFLEGFFVSDAAPEMERWIEEERTRLRRRAAEAAWALADRHRASGDAIAAAHWGRHAAALAPDDEGELRRLLEFLDELGIAPARSTPTRTSRCDSPRISRPNPPPRPRR